MKFLNSTNADLKTIFALYDSAIEFQKTVSHLQWQPFDRDLVAIEIAENRQWKIITDEGQIAAIFVTAYSDAAIWGSANNEESIYLHRIVTNPLFRGQKMVPKIVEWAKTHGPTMGKKWLRMDTWGENERLIAYYQSCGFQFLGIARPADPSRLPAHYSTITLSFFEMPLAEI